MAMSFYIKKTFTDPEPDCQGPVMRCRAALLIAG